MKGLKRIVLINSGKFPYADVDVSDTAHFSGVNGAGKSTLLRTLVFFYTANKNGLNLDPVKESFDSYYFKYSNSYIVYDVERYHMANYCILLHVNNKYIEFDFINAPYNEKWFRESKETAVYNYNVVIDNIKKDGIKVNKVKTLKEYRAVLYGNRNFGLSIEMNKYALFSISGVTMIPQIIENIFLNNNVEKGYLKNVFLYATGEANNLPILSLDTYRDTLKDYTNQKNDIEFWNSESTVLKINALIENLQKYTDARFQIKELLGNAKYLYVKAAQNKNTVNNNLQLRLSNKKEKEDNLCAINEKWYKDADKFKNLKRNIEAELNTIGKYKMKWNEFGPEETTLEISQIDKIEKERDANNVKIAFLEYNENERLSNFKELKQREEKVFSEKKESINETYSNRKSTIRGNIDIENNNYREDVKKIEKDKNSKNNEFYHLCDHKNEELTRLYQEKGKLENFDPMKTEIDSLREKKDKLITQKRDKEDNIKEIKEKLNNIPAKCEIEIRGVENGQKEELSSINISIKELESQKERIISNISMYEGSFMDWLENNKPDWKENIGKVVREDDILFNKNLSPVIGEDSDLLFGVRLNTEALHCNVVSVDEMKEKIKGIESDIEKFINRKLEIHSRILNEKNAIEKKYKYEKSSLNKLLESDKTELNFIQKTISETDSQISLLKKEGLEKKQTMLEDVDKKIGETKLNIAYYKDIIYQNENEYNKKKDELYNICMSNCDALNKQLSECDTNAKLEIEKAHNEMISAIKEIEKASQEALKKDGIDPAIINKLRRENDIKNKELERLRELKSKLQNYNEDKTNYISKESFYRQELDKLKKNFDYYEKEYNMEKKKLDSEIESIDKEIKEIQVKINEYKLVETAHNDLLKDSRFKQFYGEVLDGDEDITLFATQRAISEIQHALTFNDNVMNESNHKMHELVDFIKGRNGLCLEERNTFNLEPSRPVNDSDFVEFARGVADFQKNNLIDTFTKAAENIYKTAILSINQDFGRLIRQRREIQKMITGLNSSMEKIDFSSVIKKIELNMVNTNAWVWDVLEKIFKFGQDYSDELNGGIFSCDKDSSFYKEAGKLIDQICNIMDYYKDDSNINLGSLINIRVNTFEGANEYKNQESVKSIGSEGTSTTIKFLLNLMLLNYARSHDTQKKNDVSIHCILDEISKLDPNNTKGIINIARDLNILTLHASPSTNNPESYSNLFCLVNDDKENHRIKQIKLLL